MRRRVVRRRNMTLQRRLTDK